MSKSKMIVRTKFVDRACHWTVVICFFLVALSGISFFLPDATMVDANFSARRRWDVFCTRSSVLPSSSR
ncbi:Formate dehydrogenase N gamma subunit [Salmonella enterica subsp. enterica]|uniref:Formate dehydrogenase N gamma subunit n=1 Tax=Salmonella enterica I TaxID=59201 RepID=A0A447PJ16_SALET|nr:Formate dehydrogenase N gamma subunit [Salmonella enterica subsp. enterica]